MSHSKYLNFDLNWWIFTALALTVQIGYPQQKQGANWIFGKGASISFSSGTAISDTNSRQFSKFGCGTISDAQGNLLFYTNGSKIWNRKHQIMPNGSGLYSADSNKAVLIQKKPGSNNLYYVFVANNPIPGNMTTGNFLYSIVDMNFDNGLGDVIPLMKNILIHPRLCRMVAAAQHANNMDFWILGHGFGNGIIIPGQTLPGRYDSTFYAYRLTESGLDPNPVKTIVGQGYEVMDIYSTNGWMRTSPNSEFLAWTYLDYSFSRVNVLKLNRQTGNLSRIISLNSEGNGRGCFSTDSRFFFNAFGNGEIQTVDFSLSPLDSIFLSTRYFYPPPYPVNVYPRITDIQFGIDGKLYVNPYEGATFLSRINNPCKRFGPDIGWEPYAVDLKGRQCGLEFPVHNQTLFVNAGKLQAQAARDTICVGDSVSILAYGAGAEQFQWFRNQETASFASSGQIKVAPTQTTTYRVKGTGVCANKDTSVRVVVVPRPVANLGTERQVCEGSTFTLSTTAQNQVRYGWSSNLFPGISAINGPVANLTAPACDSLCFGFVYIRVSNSGCTVSDSVRISVFGKPRQKPILSPFPDTSFCFGGTALLRAKGFSQYKTLWSTGDSTRNITVNSSAIYSVRFKNAQGCLSDSMASVHVTVHPLPITQTLVNGKKDSTICFPANVNLGIAPSPNVSYQWQGTQTDSLSNPLISNPVFQFANSDTVVRTFDFKLLTFDITTSCRNKDSLTLKLVPYLRPDAGPDKQFCSENQSLIGKKGFAGFNYQWSPQTGLQQPQSAQTPTSLLNPSFENILSQGFIRTVSLLGCQAKDTVEVQVFPQVPKPVLSGPQFVCPGVQNVPYQLSTLPAVSTFDFFIFTFDLSGGDSTGRFLVNWGLENPNASAKIKLGNVFGCQPDSVLLPVNVTRNLRPQTLLTPGLNDSLCLASAQNIGYRILPFNPNSRYRWSMDPQALTSSSPTFDSLLLNFNLSGIYQVTLTESDTTPIAQCFGETEYKVRIWPQPTAKAILGKDSICHLGNEQFLVDNGQLESQYQWTATKGSIENMQSNGGRVNYSADFELQSDFTVVQITNTETSDKGCLGPENSKTIVVESLPKPTIMPPTQNLEWKSLENRRYEATGRSGSGFQWQAENGTVVSGQGSSKVGIDWLPNQLRYRLKVQEISRIGCLGESEYLTIPYDSALFIPNLITPNGDRKNDALFIQNLHFYPQNELTIFDRWGRKIAHSSPYNQDFPKEKIQNGLYFFSLSAGSKVLNGWVMVAE